MKLSLQNMLYCHNPSALTRWGTSSSICAPKAVRLLVLTDFLYICLSINHKQEDLPSEFGRKLFHEKESVTLLKIGWCDLQGTFVILIYLNKNVS